MTLSERFTCAAHWVSTAAGKPLTFVIMAGGLIVWAICGPITGYSEQWSLAVNTGTTIITFLMVFLIQASQNRDGAALHAKLDEIIRSSQARNDYIAAEELPEQQLDAMRGRKPSP